jgi:hypothetical protein
MAHFNCCVTLYMGFGLVTGLIRHLQFLITIHYGDIANSYILHFITVHTDSSRSAVSSPVLW